MKEFTSSSKTGEIATNKSVTQKTEVSDTRSNFHGSEIGTDKNISSMELNNTGSDEIYAKEQIEQVHTNTLNHIIENNAKYFSKEDLSRINAGLDSVEILNSDKYPGKGGSYFFANSRCSIKVASVGEWQRERSTIHETHHFASHNKEVIVPDKNGYWTHRTIGTRQYSYYHSNKTCENYGFSEHGRGLNEGITTMLTNEYLTEISPEKGRWAEQQQIYSQAVELTTSLKDIVGEATIKEAYFGGNIHPLEEKVTKLTGDGTAFEQLRNSLDKAISRDVTERVLAARQAQEILAKMYKGGRLE